MKSLIIILLCLPLVIVPSILIVKSVQFDQNCGGYLKQAADANTVELSLDRIEKALKYIEAHNLTEGYTSVLWKTEDENIGFWYQNILACRDELKAIVAKEDASQLEKSNILMKIRESLLDNFGGEDTITVPPGISRYPNNLLWGILSILTVLIIFCLLGAIVVELSRY